METPNPVEQTSSPARCALKIFGTGTAGVTLIGKLHAEGVLSAPFVAVDTSPPVAGRDAMEWIEVPKNLLGGHGSHRAEPGKVEFEAQMDLVKPACANCDVVFVIAGLGGRAGSWMSEAVARAAKEAGAMVFAFVTQPFQCEGSVRFSKARQALERLTPYCDFVFIKSHEDYVAHHSAETSVADSYAPSSRRLLAGVCHVAAALAGSTIMGVGFTDLCAMMRERGAHVLFAVGGGVGAGTAGAVVEELLAHPRLIGGKLLAEAECVAVSLLGGDDLKMADVNKVMQELGKHWQGTSHLLSASVGGGGQGSLGALMMIVTQDTAQSPSRLTPTGSGSVSEAAAFDAHFLSATGSGKSALRFSPASDEAAPAAPSRGRTARQRSNAAKLRQGQLQLDIANRGRFEKSEPTIHKGEDLDVPTFIRRGVVLN